MRLLKKQASCQRFSLKRPSGTPLRVSIACVFVLAAAGPRPHEHRAARVRRVCNICLYLRSLVTLQGHADIQVAVTEAEAVLGGAKQAKLCFLCRITHTSKLLKKTRKTGQAQGQGVSSVSAAVQRRPRMVWRGVLLTVVLLPYEALQTREDLLPLLLLSMCGRQLNCRHTAKPELQLHK